ncbi:MAG: WD40 repeat domain-containing protein [Candidatus Acidiferrales bacterium]
MRRKFQYVSPIVMAMAACVWANAPKPAAAQFGYGPGKAVNRIAFTPDGRTIVAAGMDKPASLTITLWDIQTGKSRRTFSTTAADLYDGYAFSPDARTFAVGSNPNTDIDHYTVTLRDVATGKTLHAMTGQTKQTDDNEFSPDGRTLASGSQDQRLMLFDVATGKLIREIDDPVGMVSPVAFSPDGRTLVTGSNNYEPMNDDNPADEINTIDVWDATTTNQLQTLPRQDNWTSSVAFSPDGKILATANWDAKVTLWDVASWKVLRTLSGQTDTITAVAFSPDGRTLASGCNDSSIKLWDVASGKELVTLAGHTDQVVSVVFSPDGKSLASGSFDNTIKLWDVASGKLLSTFGDPNPADANTGSAGGAR